MKQSIDKALPAAILTLLRPLVRILLRNGVAYGTFAELVKKVYVDVAYQDHTIPGKKQTISRVSAITGLTRKEAKRLLEMDEADDQDSRERYNRAIRVISGWLNDPRYWDERGNPMDLPVEGDEPSFSSLVKKYSGDIPTQAMLQTLSDAGSVTTMENGLVRLVNHAYIPGNDPVEKINILGTDVGELIATIDHNLTAPEHELKFQRKVSNRQICIDSLPEFKRISARKAQTLLEDLDEWLARHECPQEGDAAGKQSAYVSLGIYYFDEKDSQGPHS